MTATCTSNDTNNWTFFFDAELKLFQIGLFFFSILNFFFQFSEPFVLKLIHMRFDVSPIPTEEERKCILFKKSYQN